MTPLQIKMFQLARADTTLQGYLLGSNNTFRWFPLQLEKGYIYQGACVVVRQISSTVEYTQSGPICLEGVQMQVECRSLDSLQAQALAQYLFVSFFPTANFTVDNQFQSPPTPAPPAPNFRLSQQSMLDYAVQPKPAWAEILTYRLWNNVNT
jgi:hypothetical protein